MPAPSASNRTDRQTKWFATLQSTFEQATGKPIEAWIDIVRKDAPEGGRRSREKWLKDTYGLSMVRAGQIMMAMEPAAEPQDMRASLWKDAEGQALLAAFEALIVPLDGVISTQRKGYSAWSRTFQFAAMKPVRGGAVVGLALPPEADPRLSPAKNTGWSERLKAIAHVATPDEVGALAHLVEAAARNG